MNQGWFEKKGNTLIDGDLVGSKAKRNRVNRNRFSVFV